MRITILVAPFVCALSLFAQDAVRGQRTFETTCARCHGADARGSDRGPNILAAISSRNDQQLSAFIRDGRPERGMPANLVGSEEMNPLVLYLRTLAPAPARARGGARGRGRGGFARRMSVQTTDGKTIEGQVLAQGYEDLDLRSDDGIHLLRREGDRYRQVTSANDWPGYNGDPRGNRYTTIGQIDKDNLKHLAIKWTFTMPNGRDSNAPRPLEVTPVVAGGIMYVTAVNEIYALDAGSGRQLWRFHRDRTQGVVGDAGVNRGAAVAGDSVFMQTDNAHMIAVNRLTGELQWDSEIADFHLNYFSTSAPLVAGSVVVGGVGGGEHGARGVVAAFDVATGKEAWRFWTVPARGEPGSETWKGDDIDHPGSPTWFTGTYDPELDTIYWPVGNPGAEYNGDARPGDNLYSDSILALDPKTGKLKWHYQYTPHDLWDWDATETPMLVNANWGGQPRKLLLHGNRNGFFYVLDRTNGKVLVAKPFIKELTWATGVDANGRPMKLPNQEPTAEGTRVCPSQDGATNWYSPSFNPQTGLFYMQTNEKCSVYTKSDRGEWTPGRTYLGGSQRTAPGGATPERILRAINIQNGNVVWELPQPGSANGWGGTLATSTGIVFFGEEHGAMVAADAVTGKPIWSFEIGSNQSWKASPMTYGFDGKQYIAVAAGFDIVAFALAQ